MALGSNPDQYVGYKIYMTGYVNRDDNTLKANEFTLSRMSMACCIADVAPIGLTMHKKRRRIPLAIKKWVNCRRQPYLLETFTVVNNHI